MLLSGIGVSSVLAWLTSGDDVGRVEVTNLDGLQVALGANTMVDTVETS